MARTPLFIDDLRVQQALAEATQQAVDHLLTRLPELRAAQDVLPELAAGLRAQLDALVLGHPPAPPRHQPSALIHGPDAFGDPFDLNTLPLPRPAVGYGIQHLGSDRLLDRQTNTMLSVRHPRLDPLFAQFDEAYAAARQWLQTQATAVSLPPLAIVPIGYDDDLERHILIYGVLESEPLQFAE